MNHWKPIKTVPKDGTPVLVLLEEPMLGSRVHVGTFMSNGAFVGGLFSYDTPKQLGWMECPLPAICPTIVEEKVYRNCLWYAISKAQNGVVFIAASDWGSNTFRMTHKCSLAAWDTPTSFAHVEA